MASQQLREALARKEAERLTRQQAARYLGVKKGTLSAWAVTGKYNLPFTRVGRRVFYFKTDLDAFLARRRVQFEHAGD